MVFDYLILYHAHARFLDSHFRKRNTFLVGSGCRSKENLVDLFLRVGRKLLDRRTYFGNLTGQRLDVVHKSGFLLNLLCLHNQISCGKILYCFI